MMMCLSFVQNSLFSLSLFSVCCLNTFAFAQKRIYVCCSFSKHLGTYNHCGILHSQILFPDFRDIKGISKLPRILLILPYKISCINGSSEIPLISLPDLSSSKVLDSAFEHLPRVFSSDSQTPFFLPCCSQWLVR